jgi:hypothetical protein
MGNLAEEWSGDRATWFRNRHRVSRPLRGLGKPTAGIEAIDECSQASSTWPGSDDDTQALERYYKGDDGSVHVLL